MEPISVEEATQELAGIERWLAEVQANLPQHQQRGLWLQGYLAGRQCEQPKVDV